MRMAVLGAGKGAASHFRAFKEVDEIEFVAVADISAEARAEIEGEYGVKGYEDYKDLLAQEKPDAVLVALPHFLHVEAALAAVDAGAHILVEKPLAITSEGCNRIIDAANAAGKTLMVGQTHHFIPSVMEAREIVQSGDLGDVLMATDTIYSNYFTPTRSRWFFDKKAAGGGSWLANGVHLVDRTCWILGEVPKSVYGRLTFHPEMQDIETSVTAVLDFASGRTATIHMAMMANGPKEEGEILGSKASVRFSAFGGIKKMDGKESVDITPRYTGNPRARQFREFYAAVHEGREPSVTGEWGRDMVCAVLAGYKSHEEGRPIALDEV